MTSAKRRQVLRIAKEKAKKFGDT